MGVEQTLETTPTASHGRQFSRQGLREAIGRFIPKFQLTPEGTTDINKGPQMDRRGFLGLSAAAIAAPDLGLKMFGSLAEASNRTIAQNLQVTPEVKPAPEEEKHTLSWEMHYRLIAQIKEIAPGEVAVWDKAIDHLKQIDAGYKPFYKWAGTLSELNDQREQDPTIPNDKKIKNLYRKIFLGNIPEEIVPTEAVVPFYGLKYYCEAVNTDLKKALELIKKGKENKDLLTSIFQRQVLKFLNDEAAELQPTEAFVLNHEDDKVSYQNGIAVVPHEEIEVSLEGQKAVMEDEKLVREVLIPQIKDFQTAGVRTLVKTISRKYGEVSKELAEYIDAGIVGRFTMVRDKASKLVAVIEVVSDKIDPDSPLSLELVWPHELKHRISPISDLSNAMVLTPELAWSRFQTTGEVLSNPHWTPGERVGIGSDILREGEIDDRYALLSGNVVDTNSFVKGCLIYPTNAIFMSLSNGDMGKSELSTHLDSQSRFAGGINQFMEVVQNRVLTGWSLDKNLADHSLDEEPPTGMFLQDLVPNLSLGERNLDNHYIPKSERVIPSFQDFIKVYLPELEKRALAGELRAKILVQGISEVGPESFENFGMYMDFTVGKAKKSIIPSYTQGTWDDWAGYTDNFVLMSVLYDWTFNHTKRLIDTLPSSIARDLIPNFIRGRKRAVLEFDAESAGFSTVLNTKLAEHGRCPQKTDLENAAYVFRLAT